jgi:hypothetical protein
MLSTRLEGYAAILEHHDIQQTLSEAGTKEDPASAFEAGILNPLHELPQPGEGIRYLLIDALDEALARFQKLTIVDLLSTRLRRLPGWLKIVATTRGEPEVLNRLRGLKALPIEMEDPQNERDVSYYVAHQLCMPPLNALARQSGKSPVQLQGVLLRASGGNFLFATKMLEAIERKDLTFDQVETLPPGLGSLYQIFFDRVFQRAGIDFAPAQKVLQAIVTAARTAH